MVNRGLLIGLKSDVSGGSHLDSGMQGFGKLQELFHRKDSILANLRPIHSTEIPQPGIAYLRLHPAGPGKRSFDIYMRQSDLVKGFCACNREVAFDMPILPT